MLLIGTYTSVQSGFYYDSATDSLHVGNNAQRYNNYVEECY